MSLLRTELKEKEAKIEDAKANAGETEVRDAMFERAEFFARIGDKVRAADSALAKLVNHSCIRALNRMPH